MKIAGTPWNSSQKRRKEKPKKGARPKNKHKQYQVLHDLIQSHEWSQCLGQCLERPEDVHSFVNGMSVLHCSLHNRPEIRDAAAQEHAAQHTDKEATSFYELVDYLLATAPELIFSVDGLGYTALHVACSKNACVPLVRRILDRCSRPPSASSLAKLLGMSLDIAETILEFVPNPALQKDKQGKTPLFLACQRSKKRHNYKPNIDVVKLLVEHSPEAVGIQDKTCRTPLDVVKHQGKSQDILQELLQAQSRVDMSGK